eukprot:scaffold154787_cov29-Tisochrysis_lutea.AAC.3
MARCPIKTLQGGGHMPPRRSSPRNGAIRPPFSSPPSHASSSSSPVKCICGRTRGGIDSLISKLHLAFDSRPMQRRVGLRPPPGALASGTNHCPSSPRPRPTIMNNE